MPSYSTDKFGVRFTMAVVVPSTNMREARERTDGSDIYIRNFGPDDVQLPSMPLPSMQQTRFVSQQTHPILTKSSRRVFGGDKSKHLDGFRLLECCGVEFPDQAIRCDASNLNASIVASEDLTFFTNLAYLDLARNKIPNISSLSGLLELKDLRLPCNGLKTFGPMLSSLLPNSSSFYQLTHLDLSYNSFNSTKEISLLGYYIPNLQVLDLTSNDIKKLPSPEYMKNFKNLIKLILERNGLTDSNGMVEEREEKQRIQNESFSDYNMGGGGGGSYEQQVNHHHQDEEEEEYQDDSLFFECCAAIPNLQELQLGYNYLTCFPMEVCEYYVNDDQADHDSSLNSHLQQHQHINDAAQQQNPLVNQEIDEKMKQYLKRKRNGPLSQLSILGLAFNYVDHETNLYPLSLLPHISLLSIYGNPLLGSTLEDPTGQSIANFAMEVYHYRDGISTLPVDILTEVPRKKPYAVPGAEPSRKGDVAAWRSKFKNPPRQVDHSGPAMPSAGEFKTMGRQALKKVVQNHNNSLKISSSVSTAVNPNLKKPAVNPNPKKPASVINSGGDATGTFLTGIDPFESMPEIRPSSTIITSNVSIGGSNKAQYTTSQGLDAMNQDINNPNSDIMPPTIFSRNIDHSVKSDPAKLRGALSSLRHVLNHPLSGGQVQSSDEAYLLKPKRMTKLNEAGKLVVEDKRINRLTQSTKAKQKIPLVSHISLNNMKNHNSMNNGGGGHNSVSGLNGASSSSFSFKMKSYVAPPLPPELGSGVMGQGRGVVDNYSFEAVVKRKESASRNLDSIEAELDAMMEEKE